MPIFPQTSLDGSVIELELFDDAASEECIDEQDNPHLERLAAKYLDNFHEEDFEHEGRGFRTDLEELNFQTARRILNEQLVDVHKRTVALGDSETINIDDIHLADDDMPYTIQRRLLPRHLHMLALGGPLGAGLLMSAGRCITISGPLGAFLGFLFTGIITLACIRTMGEMVTLYPSQGLPLLAERFLNSSFGVVVGVLYWVLFAVAIASELSTAAALLEVYPSMSQPSSALVAWLTLFILVIILVNLLPVDYYGETMFWCNLGNLLVVIAMIITMFIVSPGGKYWREYGAFRPFYDTYSGFQLSIMDDIPLTQGKPIYGGIGRFLQVYASMTVAVFAFVGSDAMFVAAPEVKNPRRAVPSAMRRIAVRIAFCYLVGIVSLGLAMPPFDAVDGIDNSGDAVRDRVNVGGVEGVEGAEVVEGANIANGVMDGAGVDGGDVSDDFQDEVRDRVLNGFNSGILRIVRDVNGAVDNFVYTDEEPDYFSGGDGGDGASTRSTSSETPALISSPAFSSPAFSSPAFSPPGSLPPGSGSSSDDALDNPGDLLPRAPPEQNIPDTIPILGPIPLNSSNPQELLNPIFNSPWVVALSLAGHESVAVSINGILVICAVVASASHLFAASRTLYSMSTRWHQLRWFSTCTASGIPWVAVLFSSVMSLLSYLVVGYSTRHVLDWMLHGICTIGLIVWIIMCVSFLRFHRCLKVRRVPYKYSVPQPLTAWVGLVGCSLLLCFVIFSVFISWDSRLFVSSYAGIFLAIAVYLFCRLWDRSGRFVRVSEMDIYSGKRQMDLQVWDDDRVYDGWKNKLRRKVLGWL